MSIPNQEFGYVSFYIEDARTDTLVDINLNLEDIKRLMTHLEGFIVEQESE